MLDDLCYCSDLPGLFAFLRLSMNPVNGDSLSTLTNAAWKQCCCKMETSIQAFQWHIQSPSKSHITTWFFFCAVSNTKNILGVYVAISKWLVCWWECKQVSPNTAASYVCGTAETRNYYVRKDWPLRHAYIPGQQNISCTPLVDPKKFFFLHFISN